MVKNTENELSKDHILVCLSSSPSNERIVRMAGKMAQAFCGSLTALYVQTPGDTVMNTADMSRLQANMRLAQQLGAEIVTTHGEDVPTQIAEYALLSDVTKNRNRAKWCATAAFLERTDADGTTHCAGSRCGHLCHSGRGSL